MCRTIEQITEDCIIVQEMNDYIKENGADEKETLMMRVVRATFISGEQNKDDHIEILKHIEKADKNPSLVYLLRFKPRNTLSVILSVLLGTFVIFRLIEIFFGLENLVKAVLK